MAQHKSPGRLDLTYSNFCRVFKETLLEKEYQQGSIRLIAPDEYFLLRAAALLLDLKGTKDIHIYLEGYDLQEKDWEVLILTLLIGSILDDDIKTKEMKLEEIRTLKGEVELAIRIAIAIRTCNRILPLAELDVNVWWFSSHVNKLSRESLNMLHETLKYFPREGWDRERVEMRFRSLASPDVKTFHLCREYDKEVYDSFK